MDCELKNFKLWMYQSITHRYQEQLRGNMKFNSSKISLKNMDIKLSENYTEGDKN